METILTVTARSVYGSILLYPANDQARRLAAMLGTKTLTAIALSQARAMGFRLDVIGDASAVAIAQQTLGGNDYGRALHRV